jgi:outer membrane protein assembly factor BamB
MKHQRALITSAFLVLLFCSTLAQGITLQKVAAQTQTPSQTQNSPPPDDWPMFHHDLNRTGTTASNASNASDSCDCGNLLWHFFTGPSSIPSVADRLRASSTVVNGVVYALRATDGSEIWQASMGSGTDHADDSPAVANSIVYIGTRNGYYALNASTGSQIWFFTSPFSPRQYTGYVYSSPAVAVNIVYFG